MLRKLLSTQNDQVLALVRVLLGAVFFAHGAQKMLGWFGGAGFSGTMAVFASLGTPTVVGLYAIIVEFFGSLGLLVGLLSRVAAFGILVEMIGAVATVHWHNGFFMNWMGNQKGEGFEYHILVFAICLLILIRGAGAPSLDFQLSSGKQQ